MVPVVVESWTSTSIRALWITVPAIQKKKNIHLLSRAMNCRMVPVDFTLFRCRLLSSVSLAVVATTMAAFDAGLSPALAQCVGTPDNVTCSPGGNPYATGINVNTDNTPINLTLQPGVNVTIPAGSPGVNAVNAANTTGPTATSAPVTITADGVTINNNNNPTGNNQTGLRIQSSGDATITATNTTINLSGTASDCALYAIVLELAEPPMMRA